MARWRRRAGVFVSMAGTALVLLSLGSAPGRPQAAAAGPPVVRSSLVAPPLVPPPVRRGAARVVVSLETVERRGQLANGVEYEFWTFGGTVPGPLIRVRVGDTVEFHLKNAGSSRQIHSIDFHAVNGPGGGSAVTQTRPGAESVFQWKALNPGLYVYHCASPHIPTHIANGMYGLILVEPAEGLPRVDREYYIMQGEFYTRGRHGEKGLQPYDSAKAYLEQPEYVVFNGRVGALTDAGSLQAKVGETVRLFVGNGGPNLMSAFHVIGEVFDRVYPEGAMGSSPNRNIQTTLIPPGGAAVVEFTINVPGTYLMVDHSIFRIDKGAVGALTASGPAAPEVYQEIKP